MNKINFLNGNTFPLDVDTLVFMQEMITTLSEISPVFGEKVIVTGCEVKGGYVEDGWVVIDKELLRFEGNNAVSTVYIAEEEEDVICQEEKFTGLYTRRCVKFGTGDGKNNYRWADFKRLDNMPALMQKIADLQERKSDKGHTHNIGEIPDLPVGVVPKGLIAMWSGSVNNIPVGWALCNGQIVNGVTTPDLRGRFIVGYSGSGDYGKTGNTGGANSIRLSKEQLPSHSHAVDDYFRFDDSGLNLIQYGIATNRISMYDPDKGDGIDNGGIKPNSMYYKTHNTESVGRSNAIDIRPLYYVLAFIMKL